MSHTAPVRRTGSALGACALTALVLAAPGAAQPDPGTGGRDFPPARAVPGRRARRSSWTTTTSSCCRWAPASWPASRSPAPARPWCPAATTRNRRPPEGARCRSRGPAHHVWCAGPHCAAGPGPAYRGAGERPCR